MPQANTQSGGGPFENAGRTVDEHLNELGERFEQEVRRVITYLNNEVVPEVRENGSKALRVAADQLTRLADHLESRRGN
jgi:bisphosphoglycerate-dependent phosphoglycerate mutase